MTDFKSGGVPTPDYDSDDVNYISEKTEFSEDVFVYGKLYADLGGDVQTFSTAGVERVRITKEGDVAIGTNNPNVTVDISNNSILAVGIVTAREFYGTFKGSIDPSVANDKISEGNSQAEVVDTGSDGHFKVTTEGVERFRIDSSGNSTFTGNIIVDSGTVRCNDGFSSDVDLIFNADANNNGAGAIIFKESGSEKARITSGGKINIGDADQTQNTDQLSVTIASQNTSDNVARFQSDAAASGTSETLVKIYKGTGYGGVLSGYITQGSDHGLKFYTADNGTLSERLRINSSGDTTFNGDINLSGTATATTQNRKIFWTGFDKEAVGDVSDTAEIRHTTNVHGITGSVLEIKTENDVTDGIALNASSGNGQICFNGNITGDISMSSYGGSIIPSFGAGGQGIKWQGDPAGGSGDIAHIQYYADGSGENTRLRILIANDSNDDLRLEGNTIRAQGSFSKLSGSFRVPHVLAGLTTTTDLVHSFVEGPQADNLYRGRTKLVAGISTVNIDTTNNMTEGTFVNLNRDVQCFTTNETGWTAIKGSVTDNQLTIIAQDNTCTDTISWMVIGERWDLAMYDPKNPMTDANGKVKTEIPNNSYNKGGDYEQDYISENRFRVGISTISRPAIENKEIG